MSKHVSTFISKLVVHFGEPKFDVAEGDKPWAHREWLREMVQNLGDFSPNVLERAASSIAATRKHRNFPLISECKSACLDARKWLEGQKPALPIRDPSKLAETSAEREALARDLISGPMGKAAAREDWVWSLYVFAVRNARLPNDEEIKAMKKGVAEANESIERAARGELGVMSRQLLKYGQTLMQRRDEMRDFVLNGVMP